VSDTSETQQSNPALAVVWRTGIVAAVVATVINAILFLVGSLFTFPDDAITPMGEPISLALVVIVTFIGGIVATIGYTALTRFLPVKVANRVMWVGAIIVLLGMGLQPFGIENVPVAQIIILEIMHLVASLLPVGGLTRFALHT